MSKRTFRKLHFRQVVASLDQSGVAIDPLDLSQYIKHFRQTAGNFSGLWPTRLFDDLAVNVDSVWAYSRDLFR